MNTTSTIKAVTSKRGIKNLGQVPTTETVATGLGLFSLVLGATEVAFARELADSAGFNPQYSTLLRVFGVREIMSGVGLLTSGHRKAWMWSRLVGDALDVAFMTYAFARADSKDKKKRLAISATIVTPIIVMDVINSLRMAREADA